MGHMIRSIDSLTNSAWKAGSYSEDPRQQPDAPRCRTFVWEKMKKQVHLPKDGACGVSFAN